MQSCTRSSLVPGNVHDSRTVRGVCPEGGALYGDKGFCGKQAEKDALKKGCSPRFIKRNNMKEKNVDLDRYLTKIGAPYERVFSQDNKKARYKGIRQNFFGEIMTSLAFNCKRLVSIQDQIPKDFVLCGG